MTNTMAFPRIHKVLTTPLAQRRGEAGFPARNAPAEGEPVPSFDEMFEAVLLKLIRGRAA